MKKVGIFGCGWLGKPLSLELEKEFKVECFSKETTTDDAHFWQSDTLIIAMHTKDNYLATLQKIATLAHPACNLILLSSTSIYKEFNTDIDESAEITKTSLIKEAEDLLLAERKSILILRLGGLMGEDRVAGKWKSVADFTDGFVNYIHRDDVIAIIEMMLKRELHSGIFNLVAPKHPLRSQIHAKNAKKFALEVGIFSGLTRRRVLSTKIVNELSYTFLHPDPLYFWD